MYLTLALAAALLLPVPIIINRIMKRISPYRVVLEGAFTGVIGVLLIMILAAVSGQSIFDQIQGDISYITKTLAADSDIRSALGAGMTQEELSTSLGAIYEQAAKLIPSTMTIFALIGSYVEYIILDRIIKPEGQAAIRMAPFRNFDLPKSIIAGWLIIFILSWLCTKIEGMPGELLYVNINTIFDFIFCLQGMSVIFMFCYKRKAPKAIAVIIILLFYFTGLGKIALMILGFADIIFRIKERIR